MPLYSGSVLQVHTFSVHAWCFKMKLNSCYATRLSYQWGEDEKVYEYSTEQKYECYLLGLCPSPQVLYTNKQIIKIYKNKIKITSTSNFR